MIGFASRLALLLAMLLLAMTTQGCVSRNETKIAEAQARESQARYDYLSQQARTDALSAQAAAAAAEAQARADAQIGMAQANSQTAIVREQQETARATAWLSVLPWLLLGGGAVGAVWLVLWYRGRAHLIKVQAQAAMMLPAPPSWPVLPRQPERLALPGPVARRARETGTEPVAKGAGVWVLVNEDGVEVEEVRRRA